MRTVIFCLNCCREKQLESRETRVIRHLGLGLNIEQNFCSIECKDSYKRSPSLKILTSFGAASIIDTQRTENNEFLAELIIPSGLLTQFGLMVPYQIGFIATSE